MDWSVVLKTLLLCCYLILTIAIIRNIVVLTVTDCPPTSAIAKSIISNYNYYHSSLNNEQRNLSSCLTKEKNFPGCIIIGVRKGGTRALLDAIALHPQVRIVRHEVHFFDNNETFSKGLDWYKSQMPSTNPSQVAVEKTPAYFANKLTPERVHAMNPKLKLILIIRDPVTRTISDYTQVMCTRQERNKTLLRFEKMALLSDGKTINTAYKPIRNSLYSIHMEQWLKYFPLENFLIIDGDKFVKKPLSELRRVERFLDLPHSISDDQLVYDGNKHFYCFRRKNRLKAKCLGSSKGRPHSNISDDTKKILKTNFALYNEKFFKLVNCRWYW